MKSSFGSRSLKLLGLAAMVGKEELAQSFKEQFTKGWDEISSGRMKARIEQARLITEQLSQLKGAAMKAGQLLSLAPAITFLQKQLKSSLNYRAKRLRFLGKPCAEFWSKISAKMH